MITRFFTVPRVRDARSSAGWALVFIAILYTTAPAVGAMARLNLMHTIQTGEVGAVEGNVAYEQVPTWFKNWEKTGLLQFEDKNGDGRIQYYDKGIEAAAAGYGWQGNELTKVDRDIMVLANPEIAKPAQLGDRAGRGRRHRRGPLDGRRPAAGHLVVHLATTCSRASSRRTSPRRTS